MLAMNVQNDAENIGLLVSEKRPRQQNQNARLFLCCGVALLAALSMGFGLGYSSPADVDLKNDNLLTEDQTTWFAALFAVGAIFGGPVAGLLLSHGRKLTLMACSLPYVAGWVLLATGRVVPLLYLGRILTGIGAGMTSLVTPVYIAEMSSPSLRGLLGASFQLMITIGILLVYALGIPFTHVWLAIVGAGIATALVVFMGFMPDSPRYYLTLPKRDRALSVLRWLRGPNVDIDKECQEIEAALDSSNETFHLREFCQRALLKPLLISVMLMLFQQCSGINAVMFNAKDIMLTAVEGVSADVATIILAAVQVGATFLSVVLMDVAGRKVLLTIAGVLMAISSGTLGLYYQLSQNDNNATTTTAPGYLLADLTMDVEGEESHANLTWLSLVSLIIYIIGFSIGWGPVPWLIMSEIFPTKARGAASAIATAVNWLFAFIITKTFLQMAEGITYQATFWIYAGVCIFGVAFVVVFVPETKGKTLEEIEAHFTGEHTD